jgi:hypothetical protein
VVKTLHLSQGKTAIVDDEDYERVSSRKWHYNCGYVKTNDYSNGHIIIKLHRFILNAPENMIVDHINGDKLDNRKENLRLCTQNENTKNARKRASATSKYKGVSFPKTRNKWQVQIQLNKKKMHVGYYTDEIEAAKAYDKKAAELFGEYAVLNFGRNDL